MYTLQHVVDLANIDFASAQALIEQDLVASCLAKKRNRAFLLSCLETGKIEFKEKDCVFYNTDLPVLARYYLLADAEEIRLDARETEDYYKTLSTPLLFKVLEFAECFVEQIAKIIARRAIAYPSTLPLVLDLDKQLENSENRGLVLSELFRCASTKNDSLIELLKEHCTTEEQFDSIHSVIVTRYNYKSMLEWFLTSVIKVKTNTQLAKTVIDMLEREHAILSRSRIGGLCMLVVQQFGWQWLLEAVFSFSHYKDFLESLFNQGFDYIDIEKLKQSIHDGAIKETDGRRSPRRNTTEDKLKLLEELVAEIMATTDV